MALGIGKLISKYCLVTLLPAGVLYSIYSDYTRTQLYKAKLTRQNVVENFSKA